MGIQVPGGHVWHCSISLPPEDSTPARRLSDAQWAEIVRTAVHRLGFEDGKAAPCRWLAVHHGTSAGGNEHVHLAVNLVREDGTLASTWNDRRKLSRLCAEFEQRYGLRVVQGRGGAGAPGLSRAELERAARRPGREPDRVLLARIVRGATTAADHEADFVDRLRDLGALVRPRYGSGGKDQVVGYSVALPTGGPAETVWFGGGRLGRDLTLPTLRQRWPDGSIENGQALAAWRQATQPRAVSAVSATYYTPIWATTAAKVLAEVGDQLRSVPADDHAAWAGVAREMSGILSIWSVRVEGRRPGNLAFVADALAQAARTRYDEPPPRIPRQARDLRKVAKAVATATSHSNGDWAQIMLIRQMLQLVQAIEDANHARTRALQAIASANTSRERLHALTRQTDLGISSASTMGRPARMMGRDAGFGIG
nr:relaxase/mobilization nuclease domain-containing protein [Actinomadura rayongensis]